MDIVKQTEQKIYSKVLDYVSYYSRTVKEAEGRIRFYLRKFHDSFPKEYDREKFLSDVLEMLKSQGYVGDEKYAKRYFEGLILSGKSKSLKEANAYLRKKGISENIIDKYASTQGSTLQNNSLKSIIDKKCRRQEDLREPSFRNKLIRYLLSKGFNYDDIKTAVDRKASIK